MRVLAAILEDVGSKMMFFGLSCEMLERLGAKLANKSAKMGQDSWKDEFWSPVQGITRARWRVCGAPAKRITLGF